MWIYLCVREKWRERTLAYISTRQGTMKNKKDVASARVWNEKKRTKTSLNKHKQKLNKKKCIWRKIKSHLENSAAVQSTKHADGAKIPVLN